MSTRRLDDLSSYLGRGDTGRPRLTWYAQNERIELSGRVLTNWVCKATNLLVEEFDVEPAAVVSLELPVHWRAFYWALATWRLGATVLVPSPGTGPANASADVRVVLAGTPASGDVVAITPAALARSAGVALPPEHLDEAAVLSTYADDADAAGNADLGSPALIGPTVRSSFAEMLSSPTDTGQRVVVGPGIGLDVALAAAAPIWGNDGSIVLLDPQWAAAQSREELLRLAAVEAATARP